MLGLFLSGTALLASPERVVKDIYYGPEDGDEYQKQQCRIDLYLPATPEKDFPVLVYFHGGGLTGGRRGGPVPITQQGFGLVSVGYRLSPQVKAPAYLNDAADAVAWVFKNIQNYGGDLKRIFIGGKSAGCYLATMIALDKRYLEKRDIDADQIAGLLATSGQMITHFQIRKEQGISQSRGISDEYSPLYYVRKTPFPIFLQCGDNDFPCRQEENKLFVAMMRKFAKQPEDKIFYQEYPGTHNTFTGNKKVPRDRNAFLLHAAGILPGGLASFIQYLETTSR